jgi:hypothetical protein
MRSTNTTRLFYLIISFFLCIQSRAQVLNVDRELTEDSLRKKFDLVGSIFVSSDKQKRNVIDYATRLEGDIYFKNKYLLLALFRNDAVFNGKQTIQNEGMAHVRYRDMDTRKWSPEFYIQYQWNGAWGMEYRNLVGSNLRIRWMEKSGFDLYTGHGFFAEQERWNWNGVKPENIPATASDRLRRMFRFNNYVKLSAKLSDNVDWTTVSYWQFPLNGSFFQPRWFLESNVNIGIGKHFNFIVHWDHIRDRYRVVPIDLFYYTVSTGLQFNY